MGTPDFAVPCLENLLQSNHEVVAVFSQPDKPVGRKQVLTPPPVKQLAMQYDVPVYQPERLKDSDAAEVIRALQPDIIVVVAYGKILRSDILTAAPLGCINVHASLLPKYRGAAPIQWAVINGEKETGVSVMQMDEGLDTGDILLTRKTYIGEDETSEDLFDRLSAIGADALLEALEQLELGTACPQKQPEGDFGYAKMITKDLCPIDWDKPAAEIHNLVRGLQSWPVATAVFNGEVLKIHKTSVFDEFSCDGEHLPGFILPIVNRLVVCCGNETYLEILELQRQGKKRMEAKAFMQGFHLTNGHFE